MPVRRLPNTYQSVLRTLTTARNTWKITAAPDRLISALHWTKLDDAVPAALLNRYLKELTDVEIALAAQIPLSSAIAHQADRLTMFVSHFHQGLDNGIARGAFNMGARTFYGRDAGATTLPDLGSYDAVQEAAINIATGEANRLIAEGAGYVAMSNPSAAEVAVVAAAFTAARADSQLAQTYTDNQREEASALYPEAQSLAVDICDTVEFNVRLDPDASSRRAKCERWGVVYMSTLPLPGQADISLDSVVGNTISFTLGGDHAERFKLFRKGPGDLDYVLLTDSAPPGAYSDTGLAPGDYLYKAIANNSTGDGPESDAIGVTLA